MFILVPVNQCITVKTILDIANLTIAIICMEYTWNYNYVLDV